MPHQGYVSAHTSAPNDPYLDDGLRAYIVIRARRSYRQIAGCTVEDLIQEGYYCYYKCRARYVGRDPDPVPVERLDAAVSTPKRYRWLPPENPDKLARQHFMCLFKTTFARQIWTMIAKAPAGWERPISELGNGDECTTEDIWDRITPSEQETATAAVLLASAPAEIKQLFQLLISDAISGYRRFGKRRPIIRETTNRRFCRLLGLPPGYDIVGAVNRHFLG